MIILKLIALYIFSIKTYLSSANESKICFICLDYTSILYITFLNPIINIYLKLKINSIRNKCLN
jgi:hypothetical protein